MSAYLPHLTANCGPQLKPSLVFCAQQGSPSGPNSRGPARDHLATFVFANKAKLVRKQRGLAVGFLCAC